jgi:predicted ATPase/DNA-binding XRE family transcriptional regulator
MLDESRPAFGDALRRYRQAARLSQDELALKTGLSTRAISDLERGINRSPRKATLLLLADQLGLSAEERRGLEEAAQPAPLPLPHTLPAPLTSFIGREAEIAAIRRLLGRADGRLVTLTGPGGAGKTRLALEVAAALRSAFADGVWFVDLAPLTESALVVPTIARVLGVREEGRQPLEERLPAYLREKQMLVVLDNCERVVGAGPQVSALLQAAPGLKVLATSRVALRLRGEKRLAVPPLALPDLRQPTADELAQAEAMRLFVERVRDVDDSFALTEENARAVAEICVRLDGLPLALELAAARLKLLPPQPMLERLSRRLDLLGNGPRDLPARQQTLRAAIAWSYDSLPASAQRLFRRLAIFRGGRSLQAIEAVCNADGPLAADVLDEVETLVQHSLLQERTSLDGQVRFWMLETIHEFAREKLAESGEAEQLHRRHAAYFLALAEEAAPRTLGPEATRWVDRLEAEHDNLRAALGWAVDTGAVEVELRLAAALYRFWHIRGYWHEGRRWLEGALAHSAGHPGRARMKALTAAGELARAQGANDQAGAYFEESLGLARSLAEPAGSGEALVNLALVASNRGDYRRQEAFATEALALWRSLGDQWQIVSSLNMLGLALLNQGDLLRARALLQEGLDLARMLGDAGPIGNVLLNMGQLARCQGDFPAAHALYSAALAAFHTAQRKGGIANALASLGATAAQQGDYTAAAHFFAECLPLSAELGSTYGLACSMIGLAGVAAQRGQGALAARLLGAAATLLAAHGIVLDPTDQAEVVRHRAVTEAQLDAAAWAAAYGAGQAMSREEAIACALEAVPAT